MTGNMKDWILLLSQVEIWDILVRILSILPVEEKKKKEAQNILTKYLYSLAQFPTSAEYAYAHTLQDLKSLAPLIYIGTNFLIWGKGKREDEGAGERKAVFFSRLRG